MSSRINQATKDIIIRKLLNHAFSEREAEISKRSYAFADMVYNDQITPDRLRKMKTLPASFFPTASSMRVRVNGRYREWLFEKYENKRHRMIPEFLADPVQYEPDTAIAKEEHAIFVLGDALVNEKNEARTAALTILNTVTSLTALVKRWPEIEPFVASLDAYKSASTALAVPVDDVNKKLGLGGYTKPAGKPAKARAVKKVA